MASKKSTPAPPKKKRETKKKPPVVPPVTQTEAAFCHLIIQGKTPEEAAEWLGCTAADAQTWQQRPSVRQYIESYRKVFVEKMAEAEVARLVRKQITRESIAEQFMSLALLPPERTRGSVDGQVRALEAVSTLLGLKFDPKLLPAQLQGLTDEQLEAYGKGGTGTIQ